MSFIKVRMLFICAAVSFLAMPGTAIAGDESGFYIGAGTGDTSIIDSDIDASDSGYKIFAGYNIGFIPLIDIAVEASYVDFGTLSTPDKSIEVTGINTFGLVGLSLGPVGLFLKAGIVNWDEDSIVGSTNSSSSGSDPAYGAGGRFSIGSFAIRAEYEAYDLDNSIDMITISGVYTF